MNNISWQDGIGSREREHALLIVPSDKQAYLFKGGSDKNVRIVSSQYVKDGKWSRTMYVLEVSDGVRALPVTQGWETGKWREGFAQALGLEPTAKWVDIASVLNVTEGGLVGPKPDKGPGNWIIIP